MNHYAEGFEVPPRSTANLRRVAERVRTVVGLSDDKAFPVACFIEYVLPVLYDDFTLEIESMSEMGDKHGETIPDRHIIRLREDVYEGICEHDGQHRFTGMHECAHLIIHEGIPLALARHPAKNLPVFRNSEWQADGLTAEILMPFEAVKHMSADGIQAHYLVSASAAQCRRDKIDKEVAKFESLNK